MIHRVQNYSVTLTTPDVCGDGSKEVVYDSLIEKVIVYSSDADEVRRQLYLILKCKERPLVVVFTPRRRKENV